MVSVSLRRRKIVVLGGLALMALAIAWWHQGLRAPTVHALVQKIVAEAEHRNTSRFRRLMDDAYRGQEDRLMTMILASGMEDNHPERLEHLSEATSRLNYHYLEKGCHFQIDLKKFAGSWSVTRIWFCR